MQCPKCKVEIIDGRCERCGARREDGDFIYRCEKCGKYVDKLYGLFVPHLCFDCEHTIAQNDIKTGNICGICGAPRSRCCC